MNLLFLGVMSKGRSTPRSVTQEQMQQSEPTPLDFLGGDQGAAPTAGDQTQSGSSNTPAPTDAPAQGQ